MWEGGKEEGKEGGMEGGWVGGREGGREGGRGGGKKGRYVLEGRTEMWEKERETDEHHDWYLH